MINKNDRGGSRAPRIALFLPSLRGGGAERVMLTLANSFASEGINVQLVLARAEGPYLRELASSVRVVDLKTRRIGFSLLPLVCYFRRERPDAMLSAMSHSNILVLLARIFSRVKTRIVISEHSTRPFQAFSNKKLYVAFQYRFIRFLYKRADSIVAVSKGVAQEVSQLIELPAADIITIYNPHDLTAIRKKALKPLDHHWFSPGEPPVILGIGRLTEQKDFQTLIRAFARVRNQDAARLLILGEGELRIELQELAESLGLNESIFSLHGYVENPFNYLNSCSVFALSSRWEGLPNALIEALACGTAVVSTDCPSGPREILENGKWGRLVPVGDEHALGHALTKILNEAKKLNTAERAEDFRAPLAVKSYLELLIPRKEFSS